MFNVWKNNEMLHCISTSQQWNKPCNSTLQEQKNALYVELITHMTEQLNSDLINTT